MGEQFKRKRAKGYQQYADRMHEQELATATLFSRAPEVFETAYICESSAPIAHLVGETVTLHPSEDGVAVIHGGHKIGTIIDNGTHLAQSIGDEPYCPGAATGRIDEASEATGDFVVTVTDHTEGE